MTDDSILTITKDQISSNLAGEAVILNLQSGVYFGLNEVGARIWDLLQQPISVKQIRDTLLAEYTVELDDCDRDLQEILQQLQVAGLIEEAPQTV
jgi:hypothetical protein